MLTQPSRLQGWSNLFMSAAKEAPDLGHQTAGNGIHRSVKGDLRHAIHSQGPRRERAERGCLSDTRSHPELEAECSVRAVWKGVGRGRLASTGSQPPPGWALGLEVAIRSTDHKMFLKTLPPPHSDSSVLVVFSLETQLQHCWDWRWQSPGWAEPGAPGADRSAYEPHPHPAPAHSHLSTGLRFLPQRVIASSG